MTKKLVLFCDFDGTITEKDNIVAIMKRFAPPGWEAIADQVLGQQISVREGVGKMFAMLPSSLRQEIIDFIVKETKIRPGFAEFVQFCRQEQQVELLITSGGIDFFLEPILEPFDLTVPIYCNGSDFSGDTITITWPHACDEHCANDCGMCKTSIIRQYDPANYYRVVIGDSITDLAGAKIADFVIARSLLQEKCAELKLAYEPFTTFFDVIDIVKSLQTKLEAKA
ncbi:2-hydroxy-3-keto-5-methylthiopentenyl-1-phosphate phosphatase [Brevibacillus fulvus]|uniref:2-hydroxy-3-keto-5-methylthiopentenyl-1-phosphate phosphatase n=1 Tax=Brevibacillus fulvus TaxID=1125967 RepID=A0A939BT11_9BACL|nr:2-hydroxy-3-keto-5-methylthiopentenyl-1-phosphate phosphatase [Brevibacillus fulvus]MBM7591048.1 2-hydroxy-3-keto-5-methylthiopentenyl-1-phosphate phosphatase [Brevibacillus fulvus]